MHGQASKTQIIFTAPCKVSLFLAHLQCRIVLTGVARLLSPMPTRHFWLLAIYARSFSYNTKNVFEKGHFTIRGDNLR